MRFPAHRIFILLGPFFLFAYVIYAILASSGAGGVNPVIAWGLPMMGLVFFVIGIAWAVRKGHTLKLGFGQQHEVPLEHKMVAAGLVLATIGAIVALPTGLEIIFGYAVSGGLLLVLASFGVSRSHKTINTNVPAIPIAPDSIPIKTKATNTVSVTPAAPTAGPSVVKPAQSMAPGSVETNIQPGAVSWFKWLRIALIVLPILLALWVVVGLVACATDSSCQLFAP